ncbi:hypothetical protein KAJ38_03315 [Candidatus Pacearchaeota archaeon]|nr:hypothetical protein [Candidatus Pacearchaeota archaeon]
MRKVILCLLFGMFMMGLVIAEGVHEAGTGIADSEIKEAGQGTGQGLETTLQNQQKIMSGNYVGASGQQIKIQQQSNNQMRLEVGGVGADCSLNMTQKQVQNKTVLETKLSNGKNAEIKVMPDKASETALQRLRIKNCVEEDGCNIELKEVGQGNQAKLAYEVNTQRQSKVLGLFNARMQVQAQVDAETGEVIGVKKPWWAFLATEPAEE